MIVFISIFVVASYFLGTFPYMLLLSRARGVDISHERDFHAATWQKVGRLEGLSGIAIDILKGAIPILVGSVLNFPVYAVMLGGLAATCGQMWPVFQKFNGERGNTPVLGMFVAVSIVRSLPLFFFIGVIPLAIGFLVRTAPRFRIPGQTLSEKFKFGGSPSKGLPIGMLGTFALFPLLTWWLQQPLPITIGFVAAFLLVVIRRLTARLSEDLKEPKAGICRILWNRFLLDRSYSR